MRLDRRRRRLVAGDRPQRAREAPQRLAASPRRAARSRLDTEATVLGLLTRSGRAGHRLGGRPGVQRPRARHRVHQVVRRHDGRAGRPLERTSARCRGAGSTRSPTRPADAPASGATSPTRSKARSAAAPDVEPPSHRHAPPIRGAPMPKVDLPYAINDADNHFNEPPDLYERYIDPKHRTLRSATSPTSTVASCSCSPGGPRSSTPARSRTRADELTKMLGDVPIAAATSPTARGSPLPGMLLNRLNPLKGLSDEERTELISAVPRAARGLRQPRRAPRADGRPGHRQGADVPGERARHRVRVRRRPRGALREHARVQPLDPRGDRVRVRGPDVPAALHRPRRRRPRARRARDRCSRAARRWSSSSRATRTAAATTRSAAVRSPIRCSTRSGRASTRPGSGSQCTSAPPTTRSTAPTGARTPRSPSAASTRSSG